VKLNQIASAIMEKMRQDLPKTLARTAQAKEVVEHAEHDLRHARTPAGLQEYLKRERTRLKRDLLQTIWHATVRSARFMVLLAAFYLWSKDHYGWAIVMAVLFTSSEYQDRAELLQEAERNARADAARIAELAEEARAGLEARNEDLVLLTSAIASSHDARLAALEQRR